MTDESLFAAALAIPDSSARGAFLDYACAGRPERRREIEELLAAHAADNPLDRPRADLGRTGAFEPGPEDALPASPGDRIGPYRLMEQIGEGGFGLVFVAEQTEPVRRKVALKVLKPGMDTRDVVARFEAERQALALMDHPNIARVFDAGSTPAGRPYFVMELVRGVAITEYCDQNKLPPRERLALFVQVCQAVQHAHQKGIIHRDLKPSNILVAPHDGLPVVKVIDFGVAKALGQSLTDKTIYTRFAQMIGTPLYMSPEQAEINQLDVDTRADVYALGVLLYELLTGTTPFDKVRFRKAAFDEIRRIIREEEPPRPSTRLSSLGATLSTVSASRGTDPGKLAGLVRGDLDWIVMRCLEKDRSRRYDSATGLARDVERYLRDEAVEACPPTLGYWLRKAFRKHKAAVSVASVVAATLLMGILMTAWQAVRATRAEAESARQRDEAVVSKDEAVAAHAVAATQRDQATQANELLRQLAAEQRRTLYATTMNLAQAAWEGGNPARTFALLESCKPGPGETDLRGFEWYYWERFAHRDLRTVRIPALRGSSAVNALWHQAHFSPDGALVAGFVPDRDGLTAALTFWDVETGREVRTISGVANSEGYPQLAFSQDGRRLVATCAAPKVPGENTRVTARQLRVWDVATGKPLLTDDLPNSSALSPALSPDGARVACITRDGGGLTNCLLVRRLSDGGVVLRYPPDGSRAVLYQTLFCPNGKWLAGLVGEGPTGPSVLTWVVKLWDLESGRELRTLCAPGERLTHLTFSPDGGRLATSILGGPQEKVILWDCATGRQLQVVNVPGSSNALDDWNAFAFDPSGKRLAVRIEEQIHLLNVDPERDAAAPALLRTFRGHSGPVWDVVFTEGGARLLSLDQQGTIKQWDTEGAEPSLRTPFGRRSKGSFAWPGPDGFRIALVPEPGVSEPRLRFTNGSGRTIGESSLPRGRARYWAFAADGRTFGVLWQEDPEFLRLTVILWDAVTGRELRRFPSPVGKGYALFALSPDGSRVAILALNLESRSPDKKNFLTVWDVASGREVYSRPYLKYSLPTWSPDGHRIVCTQTETKDQEDQIVWVDAATGQEVRAVKAPKGQLGSEGRVVFRRDGLRLATYPENASGHIHVWDVESMFRGEAITPARTIMGHPGNIRHVEFSPDGRRLLTCGGGVVKLWALESGREVLTLKTPGDAFFSPDGHVIWGGLDEKGALWGWDGTPVPREKTP